MPELRLSDLRTGYVDLVRWVQQEGELVSPRGLMTREVQGALITLENPNDALPIGVNRGISKGIAAVEACQLLAGVTRPKLVIDIGPIFANYTEDNGEFHGAYGPRTAGQFEIMIQRLKADPDTRQAVTTIWDKNFDLLSNKRDYPCTLIFVFHVRNNRLNLRVHMRSNDVIKGVAYDFFQFTRVQIAIASVLGIEPGHYFHYADSLHLYDTDRALVDKLTYPGDEGDHVNVPAITGSSWDVIKLKAWECIQSAESGVLNGGLPLSKEQLWYAEAMLTAAERNRG